MNTNGMHPEVLAAYKATLGRADRILLIGGVLAAVCLMASLWFSAPWVFVVGVVALVIGAIPTARYAGISYAARQHFSDWELEAYLIRRTLEEAGVEECRISELVATEIARVSAMP